MGPAAYGLYALGWTLLRMLGVLGVLGLDSAAVRFGAAGRGEAPSRLKGTIVYSIGLAVLAGSLLSVTLAALAPWLGERVFGKPELLPYLTAFAPGLAFFALMQVGAAVTRASERMFYSVATRDLGQPLLHLVLVGVVVALDQGALSAVRAAVVSLAAAGAVALFFVVRLFPVVLDRATRSDREGGRLLRFSLPAMLGGVFSMFLVWLDRLMVGIFRPEAEVGIYQTASQIAILFPVILTALGTAFAPMAARLYAGRRVDQMEALFRLSTGWGVRLGVPLLIVVCALPGDLLEMLFGPPYRAGAAVLVILAVGQFVNLATGPMNAVYMMTGLERPWLVISAAALLIDAILNWLLIPRWGIEGAAVATCSSLVLLFGVGLFNLRALIGVTPYDRRFLPIGLAAGASVLAAAPAYLWSSGSPPARVVLGTVSVTAAFVAVTALRGLDADERSFISGVLRRRPSGGGDS